MAFLTKARSNHIVIEFISSNSKITKAAQALASQSGFKANAGDILILRKPDGSVDKIYAGIHNPAQLYDAAAIAQKIQASFSDSFLKDASFEAKANKGDIYNLCLGWAIGAYSFDRYLDKKTAPYPALLWPQGAEKTRINALKSSIFMLRDLINTPTIDMGPSDLESSVRTIAEQYKAKFKVTKGKSLEKGFPLVHAVGMAAGKDRAPRLLELSWGKAKDPKLSIVGKGVCFDTGGLDIKPSAYMKLMKKDMGGAAHALALAQLVMALKLPVNLHLVIPAVENAVAGDSFRPGDVFTSRKGTTVENTNTDAEGRLILADALTYASERDPDLIIDFATLTGSARAALGMDIPAAFSNDEQIRTKLTPITEKAEDMVWVMPLHQNYQPRIKSKIATLHNSASVPGDLIYSALFLEHFVGENTPWVHIDCFAWEQFGAAGRPVGGKDTGLRGMLAVIEDLYT